MTSQLQQAFRPSAKKRRILVVEDEFINQSILSLYLEEEYEVVLASTGQEALDAVHSQPDALSLILLDLNLPDLHGLEVLRQVKADPLYARLPVIVMTADSEAEVECLNLGAIDFIPKPYPRQKVVLARVRRTIELSEDRDTIRWTERDNLTGLYNREFFFRYAVQLDQQYRDFPTDAIVLDINHFHIINDRYGRAFGDEVLRRVAEKAMELVQRSGGIAAHGEADVFFLYCPHRTDYAAILDELSVPLEADGSGDNRIRLRMGVYSNADKALDVMRRFDRAKMAADTVKGSYSGSIGLYDDSMHEKELLSEQLIEDFPAAIRERQFQVFFQPKFNIRSDEPVLSSAEALVRWKHPKMGMVSPGVFIPLFENNGLIPTLDHYVWSETAAQIRRWKDDFGVSLPVSVNVSRVDLYDPDLAGKLRDIVEKNGLLYEELLLEITESAYTEDSQRIIDTVKGLRKMGFKIEMDDFGSGYSSLGMLSSLPIDALKLDMQFIRSAFRERKDTRLLEAMIRLAESFEVPTIAEGVETAEQVFTLKAMGCDIIQGYYFSRPLPAPEFEKFITAKKNSEAPRPETKRRRHRDRFTYNALHDPLTGLYNFSGFDILFHDSDHEHIAVMLAEVRDYDRWKREKGKPYADRAICRVAEALRSSFRSVDHICRLQEDEFAVIMTRITGSGKDLVAAKLEEVLCKLRESGDGLEPIELSVGAAFFDADRSEEDVFLAADDALQRQKESGRPGYAIR
ncbi:MAG: EAL domain-containing protein [Oscillospiraceae bacterium]|nr:EAL domain-containing protein [Oscillospiraceae bacterium]